MKRLIILFMISFLPLGLHAQSSKLDGIFDEYAGRKEYQTIIYGKTMLSMMREGASSDVQVLLDGIKTIRIISYKGTAEDLCNKVLAKIKTDYRLISKMTGEVLNLQQPCKVLEAVSTVVTTLMAIIFCIMAVYIISTAVILLMGGAKG